MVLKCEDIWREVSNYIDGDVDPQLKVAMEQHIAGCQKCRAVLAGSRNVVQIYGDDRAFRLPADFYPQLHQVGRSRPRPWSPGGFGVDSGSRRRDPSRRFGLGGEGA